MSPTDNDFFEAYKHLDKLCCEVLNCSNGVSTYIEQMEASPSGRRLVPAWDSDYSALKHIRWVRNQIAHDTTGCTISSESDLDFAEEFYDRIMDQDDPFARLHRVKGPTPAGEHRKSVPAPASHRYDKGDRMYAAGKNMTFPARKQRRRFIAPLILALIVLFLLCLYFLFR